jgi:basic membrane protein A
MSTSKFTKFSQEQYDSLYASIVDGTLAIDDSYDADVKPAVTTITVDYQS